MQEAIRPRPRCFLALPLHAGFELVSETVRQAVRSAGFQPRSFSDVTQHGTPVQRILAAELARADCVVADVSGSRPNVFYEVGLARAMGKHVVILSRGGVTDQAPFDLADLDILKYETSPAGLTQLGKELRFALGEFRRFPRRARGYGGRALPTPFFVDWDILERPEAENLCLELLAQMGFRRLEWGKQSEFVDIAAELPKKDPDGFEYRELWLVSMGRSASQEVLLDMLRRDPPGFIWREVWSRHGPEGLGDRASAPITFLIILLKPVAEQRALFDMERWASRWRHLPPGVATPRIRVWDRGYLTSLVQQFPQIGFKYFSEDGRSLSKFRKTPEELYRENVRLTERLTFANAALEAEKNLRVRAERDAVWKDISFSAAHKIGNPIFAIETNLDPLERRVESGRGDEAKEVIRSIRASVEKAKGIIDQFKSLTRAQEVTPAPTLLRPILEDACDTARAKGCLCEVDCPPGVLVNADSERLAECFDELVSNAMQCSESTGLRIMAQVSQPQQEALPGPVDSAKQYILIHFTDNGPGVAVENKEKIFDAFYTTHEHGTGLGLALVRRIVEGNGGIIREVGIPAHGADFEIYLPRAIQEAEVPADASASQRDT